MCTRGVTIRGSVVLPDGLLGDGHLNDRAAVSEPGEQLVDLGVDRRTSDVAVGAGADQAEEAEEERVGRGGGGQVVVRHAMTLSQSADDLKAVDQDLLETT